jgi:hypothetical protein
VDATRINWSQSVKKHNSSLGDAWRLRPSIAIARQVVVFEDAFGGIAFDILFRLHLVDGNL